MPISKSDIPSIQVGVGANVRMPVDLLGRNFNSSDPIGTIGNTSYSMGMWLYEDVRYDRQVIMADLINPAGVRVSANSTSLLSAINDFSDSNDTKLVLGTLPLPRRALLLPFASLVGAHSSHGCVDLRDRQERARTAGR